MQSLTEVNLELTKEHLEYLQRMMKEGKQIKSILTIKSKAHGKDYTIKLNSWVHPTYKSFSIYGGIEKMYLEFLKVGVYNCTTQNFYCEAPLTLGCRLFSFIVANILKGNHKLILDNYQVFTNGKCLKCNRTLTDEGSIQRGIGPVCMSY